MSRCERSCCSASWLQDCDAGRGRAGCRGTERHTQIRLHCRARESRVALLLHNLTSYFLSSHFNTLAATESFLILLCIPSYNCFGIVRSIVAAASSGTRIALHDGPRTASLGKISLAAHDQWATSPQQSPSMRFYGCNVLRNSHADHRQVCTSLGCWKHSSESHTADSPRLHWTSHFCHFFFNAILILVASCLTERTRSCLVPLCTASKVRTSKGSWLRQDHPRTSHRCHFALANTKCSHKRLLVMEIGRQLNHPFPVVALVELSHSLETRTSCTRANRKWSSTATTEAQIQERLSRQCAVT